MNNCGKLDGKMRTCVVWVNPTVENMGFLLGDHIFSSKGGRMYTCEEAVVWKYSSGMDKVPTLTFLQLKSEINCILQADPNAQKNAPCTKSFIFELYFINHIFNNWSILQ